VPAPVALVADHFGFTADRTMAARAPLPINRMNGA
jgi:hypothetical protein